MVGQFKKFFFGQTNRHSTFSHTRENSKMFNILDFSLINHLQAESRVQQRIFLNAIPVRIIDLWYMYVMIDFQVLLNFDPVKKILKMQCQIYLLMKKVINLRIMQKTLKTFAPRFFNYFSLSLNRINHVKMRAMRKKLNIFTLHLSFCYILEQEIAIAANPDIVKTKREKQILQPISAYAGRSTQCLLLRLKSVSVKDASRYPAFMGNCSTISHKCQSYLPTR